MITGAPLYMPILTTDPGRLQGLALTPDAVRGRLLPLLEVTPVPVVDREPAVRAQQLADHLDEVVTAVARASGGRPILIDAGDAGTERGGDCARTADGRVHLAYLLDEARARALPCRPVTGLRRPDAYQLAVADAAGTDGRGVALRLGRPDFREPHTLAPRTFEQLAALGVAPDATDLIVDVGGVTAGHLAACVRAARAVLEALVGEATWRSVTIAAATQLGAVPPGTARGPRAVPRTDWLLWRALTSGGRETAADVTPLLARYADRAALRFGDYGPLLYGPHPVRPDGAAEWVGFAHGAEWLVHDLAAGSAGGRVAGPTPLALHVVRDSDAPRLPPDRRPGRAAAVAHHLTVAVEQLGLDPLGIEPLGHDPLGHEPADPDRPAPPAGTVTAPPARAYATSHAAGRD